MESRSRNGYMIDRILHAASCVVSCGSEHGTGHLIRSDRVLTARHCVIDAIDAQSDIVLTFATTFGDRDEQQVNATVVADDPELDVCILAIDRIANRSPLLARSDLPREGLRWVSFGFPKGKSIGHRLCGEIAQVLPAPTAKVDIDLSVDPLVKLDSYNGMSGAAVVVDGRSYGMLRLRHNGTVAAISTKAVAAFLGQHDIPIDVDDAEHGIPRQPADRSRFQSSFEEAIVASGGNYLFLEGAHGIGKTTFCYRFIPMDPKIVHLGAYCVLEPHERSNTVARSQADVLYDWLITAIPPQLSRQVPRHQRRTYAQMVDDTSSLFEAIKQHCGPENRHAVIFIDGLNEIDAVDPALVPKFIGILPPELPKHVTVVLSSPNYARIAPKLLGRVAAENVHSIPPLTEDACLEYCHRMLRSSRASNMGFVRDVCKRANGHPLYLNYLIRHANDPDDLPLDDFPVLDGPIEKYYERVWHSLADDDNAVNLLSVISRLREGLPSGEIVIALTDTEQAAFTNTIARIQHLFLRRDFTAIYHSSFKDFVAEKTVHLDRIMHARLAEFCLDGNSAYCVRNSVFHLLEPRRRTALRRSKCAIKNGSMPALPRVLCLMC